MFSEHNSTRLEVNHKKKTAKTTNIWRLNNMLVINQWIIKEIKWRIKKVIPGDKLKMKTHDTKTMGYCRSNRKRDVYSDTSLPQ